MKKILVLLLAFGLVFGAIAQAKVSIALDGIWTIVNQDVKAIGPYANNSGATSIGISASSENAVSGVDAGVGGMGAVGPLTVSSFDAWYKVGDMVTLKFGNFGNYDLETTSAWSGAYDKGYFSQKNQMQVKVSAAGANIYVDLPVATAGGLLVDALKTTEILGSYAIDQIGTVKAWAKLGLVTGGSNTFGGAFSLSAVEKLSLTVSADMAGTGATALAYGVWATYKGVENLTVIAEFINIASGMHVYTDVGYNIGNGMAADLAAHFGVTGTAYDVRARFSYDLASGLRVRPWVKYAKAAPSLTYALPIYWTIAL
ncbi:MAG: hypothetical protein WCQ50_14995 [Spirochaetota bacterium]